MKAFPNTLKLACATVSALAAASLLISCGSKAPVTATAAATPVATSVAVAKASRKSLAQTLTISSELVPFQQIDVYAKESGYVTNLNVDYGSHVKAYDVMAVLEIPELQAQIKQDDAAIRNAEDQITYAQNELSRVQATHKALQSNFDRLDKVSKTKPGLVAQQEVDDAEAKADASAEQIQEATSNIASAQSLLAVAQDKKDHDQVLFNYSRITAPFEGVVTQRYANKGTLMQAGTNSSTQAMPLVRLSEDDLFRLVIPVPGSDVPLIHLGEPVTVTVPSLNNRTFPGAVSRFSDDIAEDTRTMHTEVNVPNPQRVLIPGMYVQATLTLARKNNALSVPVQALAQNGDSSTVDLVDSAGKIQIRPVVIGIQTPTDAEIVSGLEDGDMVVVGDTSSLKAGQVVHPQVTQLMQYQGQEDKN